jgi:hypothetical protein
VRNRNHFVSHDSRCHEGKPGSGPHRGQPRGPVRRLQTLHEQDRTLAPPKKAKAPGTSLTADGLYGQMEVTTIGDMMETLAALLIGAGAIAGVILATIIVVAAGWFFQASR